MLTAEKLDLKRKVQDFMIKGLILEDISIKLGINLQTLRDIINYKPSLEIALGCKTESYFTEEEMLRGVDCTYDDLSECEKFIYDKL